MNVVRTPLWLCLTASLVLLLTGLPANAADPMELAREQALANLRNPDLGMRRQAVARLALVGFLALSQDLAAGELVAIGLVVAASAGALRSAATPAPRDG